MVERIHEQTNNINFLSSQINKITYILNNNIQIKWLIPFKAPASFAAGSVVWVCGRQHPINSKTNTDSNDSKTVDDSDSKTSNSSNTRNSQTSNNTMYICIGRQHAPWPGQAPPVGSGLGDITSIVVEYSML